MKIYKSFDALSILKKLYGNRYKGLEILGRRYGFNKKMQLLMDNNLECISCKRVATMAFLQSYKEEAPHIGFYIRNDRGGKKWIALTIDHIVPLSKGGINNIENNQIMCVDCNSRKGNILGNLNGINWLKLSKEERKQLKEELECQL